MACNKETHMEPGQALHYISHMKELDILQLNHSQYITAVCAIISVLQKHNQTSTA